MSEATAWANKRKAAIENAKRLREQRLSGANEEQPTFKPQLTKRPSFLNQRKDSLDELAGDFRPDPNDMFEQPLPAARGINSYAYGDGGEGKAPSPGQDSLGKELKRYPTGSKPQYNDDNDIYGGSGRQPNPVQSQQGSGYKSKFLQQYGESSEPDSYATSNSEQEYGVAAENLDSQFMNSLRSGGRNDTGPGWNDDTTSNGFAPANELRQKKKAGSGARPSRQQQQQQQQQQFSDSYHDQQPQPSPPKRKVQNGIGMSNHGAGTSATKGFEQREAWNMDTNLDFLPSASAPLPARASRGTPPPHHHHHHHQQQQLYPHSLL